VAIVLHSRRTAGGDRIDHLVVAASGVWVIEARHDRGKVERRRESGRRPAWLRTRDGDRIEIVEACDEVGVVERHLERMGFEWLHVRRAVCLTNANWGMVRRPFVVDGVIVTWGRALVEKIAVPGPLSPFDMRAVAVELSARLPAAF